MAVGGYLLGSIPTGYLVAKARGIDIRTVGSKNMGATNVFRTLGKGPGIFVLLVDAFDKTGFAPSLANREFFENAFAKLAGNGVLVINLAGEKESYEGLIGEAMHVFDDQVIVISVPDDGNHVLYAFKERYFEPRWRWLHNYAKELRAKFGLDFPAFVQKMERSTKLGLARREAIRRR